MTDWHPSLTDGRCNRPTAGQLVAFERQPHRVIEVLDRERVDWPEEYREAWIAARMPDPWWNAPYVVVLRPLPSGKRRHLLIPGSRRWDLLPDHYAVCSVCGELAPCSEVTAQRHAVRVMEGAERLYKILPGCCWACGEAITSRQAVRVFPGENLLLPTAPPDPVFHARRDCVSRAAAYEEMWASADPSRPRSLLTLTCTGSVVVHGDGSAECFGAVDSDCPDVRARHRSYSACYALSHGCPKDCPREGHPGCRVAGAIR